MQLSVSIDESLYRDARAAVEKSVTDGELVETALRALIRIVAAKRLAELGGSTVDMQPVPRRQNGGLGGM